MTSREFFIETIKDEIPRFEKVFKAMPKKKLSWRPHKRSRSTAEIVPAMALEAMTFVIFLKTGKIDFATVIPKMPKSFDEGVKVFMAELLKAKSYAKKMTEKDWASKAEMMTGEKVDWAATKGSMALSLLLDLVHHRGQLSTYIRPMGGKVPSIYGPSGDSN